MNRSFAYSPGRRQRPMSRFAAPLALAAAVALAACATLPPPTTELAAAQQALASAGDADAAQYAPEDYESARAELQQAQSAMAAGDDATARAAALVAAAGGDLARARSRAVVLDNDYAQRRAEIARLRAQLQVDDAEPARLPVPPVPQDTQAMGPELRLQALDTDPRFAGAAAYERLRAQQAVQALATARQRDRPTALVLAARRVGAAEYAAHAELLEREVRRLDQVRADLLVEASRRDAERARQEAERLRLQAQIQAEETQRLRAAAEAEAAARQQAEEVILDVGGEQADKLKAAREREAELARQEAALLEAQQAASGAGAGTKPAPKAAPKPAKKRK